MAGEKKKGGCFSVIVVGLFLFIFVPAIIGKNSKTNNGESTDTSKVQINTPSDSSENGDEISESLNGKSEVSEEDEIEEEVNQIVYDDGEIKITYTGYTAEKAFSSAKINFLIENNSSKNISVKNFNLNVNGYTFSTWFYEDVPAGKKSNAEMSISRSQLKDNGIESLGIVDMDFRCIDSDNYDELFTTDNIQIIFDENASNEENIENYQLIIDNSNIQVYYKGKNDGDFLSKVSYTFLVVNNSDQNVTVHSDNLSVNDFAVSSYFYTDCMAGKMSNDTLTLYASDLDKNGIEKIEKIEFTLKCYNSDNYSDIWQQDNVVISFE